MSIIILHFEAVYGVDDFSVTEQSLPPVAREELALRGDNNNNNNKMKNETPVRNVKLKTRTDNRKIRQADK